MRQLLRQAALATLISLVATIQLLTAPNNAARAAPPPDGPSRIRGDQWHLQYLKLAQAHQVSLGEDVAVAVPDTGVDPHPDLRNNLLPGIDITAPGRDGRNDRNSHGTSMAGLIAAHGQTPTMGALGIAPEAKIVPIRFQLDSQSGDMAALARAIEYSVEQGVQVISVSVGGPPSLELQNAVATAISANIVVVAAVGNRPQEGTVAFPAAYPGVLAVGGITKTGEIAEISVSGPEVDLVAPATEIFSTSIGGNYSKGDGTSGAAAIVAGAVALIKARYPQLPAMEVVHRLTATAIDKGPPGRDDQYGYGVIDIVAALTADVPPLGFESTAPDASSTPPASAQAQPDEDGNTATTRGLVTLGVIVVAGGAWAVIVRRRRQSDDPPPRVSR